MDSLYKLSDKMKPKGDQPRAIKQIVEGFEKGQKEQVLVGVTGSGKTFTMANVIAKLNKPVLVMSHNKTLAAQLYAELKEFFPDNAVEYFVSYYDYYQPEAYVAKTDTYIEKDASINDDLDRLRLAATSSILSRRDTIVVSSVSSIYGLGSPEDWLGMLVRVNVGEEYERDEFLASLVQIQYERVEGELKRGSFRIRGSRLEIYPSYGENPHRIEFNDDDQVEKIEILDAIHLKPLKELEKLALYPAKHFVTSFERLQEAIEGIETELVGRIKQLTLEGKDLEAKRLESRTQYDIEMLKEMGYCGGVENYSRHLSGRKPGETPYTLIDYFPKDYFMIIDESHQSVPQIRGMFNGDRSRKQVLVDHGFRLPSALDNRPLKFEEFQKKVGKILYVSATPATYERERADQKVEQIIRPTGLMDPILEVRKTEFQIDDLIGEVKARAKKDERTLVTTLTKKMAEDLSRYLKDAGVKVHYLHSEFDAFERVEILQDLRRKKYDCLIGVNLLREGLDLPEVSLVAILDADKEGFLRNDVSLIQIAGRAARNVNGFVILYADKMTEAMKTAIGETSRRRKIQQEYNEKHGIEPQTIQKEIKEGIEKWKEAEDFVADVVGVDRKEHELKSYLAFLKKRMEQAAHALEFDRAAHYRDEIRKVEAKEGLRESVLTSPLTPKATSKRKK